MSRSRIRHKSTGNSDGTSDVLAWLGLRWPWLTKSPGQAKSQSHGLALAWLGLSHGFWVQHDKYVLSIQIIIFQIFWIIY
jgi:hypothetical protein